MLIALLHIIQVRNLEKQPKIVVMFIYIYAKRQKKKKNTLPIIQLQHKFIPIKIYKNYYETNEKLRE